MRLYLVRLILTLLLLADFQGAFSRESAALIDSRCEQVAESAQKELSNRRFFMSDSANGVFTRWEQACGPAEPVLRGRIVWKLNRSEPVDSLVKIYNRRYFELSNERFKTAQLPYRDVVFLRNPANFDFVPPGGAFDSLTVALALPYRDRYAGNPRLQYFFRLIGGSFARAYNSDGLGLAGTRVNRALLRDQFRMHYFNIWIGGMASDMAGHSLYVPGINLEMDYGFTSASFLFSPVVGLSILGAQRPFRFMYKTDDGVQPARGNGLALFHAGLLDERHINRRYKLVSAVSAGLVLTGTGIKAGESPVPNDDQDEDAEYSAFGRAVSLYFSLARKSRNGSPTLNLRLTEVDFSFDKKVQSRFAGTVVTVGIGGGF